MSVGLLIPWRGGCEHREKALEWVLDRYLEVLPDAEVTFGSCADGPFNRSQATLVAASWNSADVFVVTDGDVFCDPTLAIGNLGASGWAVPHKLIHRLSQESTEKVLAGADWRDLPLSTDNPQDRRPYKGNETGTLYVIRRELLFDVPPDVRFVGWGQEDQAHRYALRTLAGKPWRGTDDLVHLWHPPQERQNRRVGNPTSLALLGRYRKADRRPEPMRALIEEANEWLKSA